MNAKWAVDYVAANELRLITLIQDLVCIPSENHSPQGAEAECQRYIAGVLDRAGYQPELYELESLAGLAKHPLATPDRDYKGRPNLAATRKGTGGGRSLILSGHIDTVPQGTLAWSRNAFEPAIVDDRLYGRGSNDMKAGIAMNLFVMEALASAGQQLRGDVMFESVVDEEFGGVNGTLAARLHGAHADAAIVTEPSFTRICAGQRGGRTVHLEFSAASGGILSSGSGGSVVQQMTHFLVSLESFATERRNRCVKHALYQNCEDPVPVTVTKLTTGPWGTSEPITAPEQGRIELYWQLMPGEKQQEIDAEFFAWFHEMISAAPKLFANAPRVTFPIRWLPGSAIKASADVCVELQQAAASTIGRTPEVVGIEGPCDLFVFHEFGIPAVLWGPAGGNTHGSDEFVSLSSVREATATLLHFIGNWCGATP
jgi:acetylornithine deacetylase